MIYKNIILFLLEINRNKTPSPDNTTFLFFQKFLQLGI